MIPYTPFTLVQFNILFEPHVPPIILGTGGTVSGPCPVGETDLSRKQLQHVGSLKNLLHMGKTGIVMATVFVMAKNWKPIWIN